MGTNYKKSNAGNPLDRVDGKLKVTGAAKYSAEYEIQGTAYGVLVSGTVAKGRITDLNTVAAENAPGVLAVLSHLNCPKVPGYEEGGNPAKGHVKGRELRIFSSNRIYFSGQPIALVIADTFERALYASTLVKAKYQKEPHKTNLIASKATAFTPKNDQDYERGSKDGLLSAPVKVDNEYVIAREIHNPMELHAIIAVWDGDDKVTVYDKSQGVKSTQRSIMDAFRLKEENVKVVSTFVGGAFGSALRTWPHEIAALIGAKKIGKPLKLVLGRDQMFTMVGYRPFTWQRVALGATRDGKLTHIWHQAIGETSSYEEFTEGSTNLSKFLYKCPNVKTDYKIVSLDLSTPTWMRGPGEATGAFALECAIDEMAHALKMDPLDFRLKNYAETDPEKKLPFSSKFLKEAYLMGAEKIGWNSKSPEPGSMKDGDWQIGYGVGTGVFGAYRGKSSATVRLSQDGTVLIQTAATDIGPGTGTSMAKIASDILGVSAENIKVDLGRTDFADAPTQGGSSLNASLGAAVHKTCVEIKRKIYELATKPQGSPFKNVKFESLEYVDGHVQLPEDHNKTVSYSELLANNDLKDITLTESSEGLTDEWKKYSFYSFSVHFVQVKVHRLTGVVRVTKVVSGADAGTIVSEKTARSQMVGGVVGGIGMALTEEGLIDDRFGRYVNNNLADYHVPVNADTPPIEIFFVNKPDPYINAMGAKGMGEIALIGFSAAVANAVFHATGKRIRNLPITPDKVLT